MPNGGRPAPERTSGRVAHNDNHGPGGVHAAHPASSGRQGETRVTFWTDVPDEDREELEQLGWVRSFPAGVLILRERDASSHVILLRSGCVKVVCHSDDGYEVVLGIRDAGDLVGELASPAGEGRSASVYAISDVEALVVPAGRFYGFVRTHPDTAVALHATLSARLREADRYRASAATEPVERRLAALLLELGERYGQPDATGAILIDLPLCQDELAGLLLTSRRTIGRVLMKLRRTGTVVTGRRVIILREPATLRDMLR
ncbi:MAG: family transcriptional regulator, cyclic receptor protein [Micromonosporaceae bacterium]|nr:family transcriptional regulator, cyclic receptor protein [Micromonosporaceae bacterium]